MEDRGAGVERKRRVRRQLGVVPRALGVPEDADHVLGEEAAETRVRQQSLALEGRHAPPHAVDLERDRRGARSHGAPNTTFRRAWPPDTKEAGSCDPASREEGRGSWF